MSAGADSDARRTTGDSQMGDDADLWGGESAWWITRGGGEKVLGPFATRDLALTVRTYVESAHAPRTYWVEVLSAR